MGCVRTFLASADYWPSDSKIKQCCTKKLKGQKNFPIRTKRK